MGLSEWESGTGQAVRCRPAQSKPNSGEKVEALGDGPGAPELLERLGRGHQPLDLFGMGCPSKVLSASARENVC